MSREKLVATCRRLALILFWPAAALVIWGELTPNPPSELAQIWDKAEHFSAYCGLAGMVTLAIGFRRALPWALAGVLAMGGALEILQGYTGRDPEWLDMLANSLGWLCGAALGAFFLLLARPARLPGPQASD